MLLAIYKGINARSAVTIFSTKNLLKPLTLIVVSYYGHPVSERGVLRTVPVFASGVKAASSAGSAGANFANCWMA